MTVLEWLQELGEEERIIKVGCVDNTLRGLRHCTARMAATSYLHWACPEYLAPQIGLAFECKSPAVNNEKFCERCAAAFLSAQMPWPGWWKTPLPPAKPTALYCAAPTAYTTTARVAC